MIRNKINHKVYIGQSDNILRRWEEHKNRSKSSNKRWSDSYLYRSIRKYGLENFEFKVLEETTIEMLNEREEYYIIKCNSTERDKGYNMGIVFNRRYYKGSTISEDTLKNVIYLLKNSNKRFIDIAKLNNISLSMVSYINTGYCFSNKSFDYPLRKKPLNKKVKYNKGDRVLYVHNCIICNKEFESSTYEKKYCSNKCLSVSKSTKIPEKEVLLDLIEKYNNYTEISKIFGVTPNAVKKWLKKYDIELLNTTNDYPSFVEIYKKSFEFENFKSLSSYFNINYSTLRWYLEKNNLPYTIKDIRNYKFLD